MSILLMLNYLLLILLSQIIICWLSRLFLLMIETTFLLRCLWRFLFQVSALFYWSINTNRLLLELANLNVLTVSISRSMCLGGITSHNIVSVIFNFAEWSTFLLILMLPYIIDLIWVIRTLTTEMTGTTSWSLLALSALISIRSTWRECPSSFINDHASISVVINIFIIHRLPWSVSVKSCSICDHRLRKLTLSLLNYIERQLLTNIVNFIIHFILNILILFLLNLIRWYDFLIYIVLVMQHLTIGSHRSFEVRLHLLHLLIHLILLLFGNRLVLVWLSIRVWVLIVRILNLK